MILRRRLGVVLLAALVAFGLAWISTSNAASLTLAADSALVFVSGAERCQNGSLTVSPSGTPTGGQYTQVTVSGITGSCSIGGVAVIAAAPPHTVLFSATGTVAGGSFTASSSAFTPPASAGGVALVSLDGWIMPATWTFTPPPPPSTGPATCRIPANPSIPCTATLVGTTQWGWPTTTHWQRFIEVTTNHPAPVVWEVTINLSDPAYPIFANRLQDLQAGLVLVSVSPCNVSPRTVTVRGTTNWGSYHQVWAGKWLTHMQVEGSTTGTGNLLTCP